MCYFNKIYLFAFIIFVFHNCYKIIILNRMYLKISLSLIKVTKVGEGKNVPLFHFSCVVLHNFVNIFK